MPHYSFKIGFPNITVVLVVHGCISSENTVPTYICGIFKSQCIHLGEIKKKTTTFMQESN